MAKVKGVYGILPQDIPLKLLLKMARAALDGGVRVLQLRDKSLPMSVVDQRLGDLLHLTQSYQATLILNDRFSELSVGVHVGRDDFGQLSQLRLRCGNRVLGVTCKGDLDFASQALAVGVDYISLGAMYPTLSKKDAKPISIGLLKKARERFPYANIVAIGGIKAHHFSELRESGADSVAMIQGLFGAKNIEKQAQLLTKYWNGL